MKEHKYFVIVILLLTIFVGLCGIKIKDNSDKMSSSISFLRIKNEEFGNKLKELTKNLSDLDKEVDFKYKDSISFTENSLELKDNRLQRLVVDTYSSVVSVEWLLPQIDYYTGEILGPPVWRIVGSGVIINSSGLVLTAGHVVNPPFELQVEGMRIKLADGQIVEITKSVYFDINNDIDLGLCETDLPKGYEISSAMLGSIKDLHIGQQMVAIGNPAGFEHSVSTGILSSIRYEKFSNWSPNLLWLQTDIPINGGNSGGPLFGLDGRCYGICSWGVVGGDGLNFFVPVNVIKESIPKLLEMLYEN